jgi:beta-glucosidase
MKHIHYLIALMLTPSWWGSVPLVAQTQYPFQNPDLAIEQRVDNILSLMTLEEKVAFLSTRAAMARLNIPDPGRSEAIHGLVFKGGRNNAKPIPTTSFAQGIGMGETWDPDLVRRAGAVMGYEARYITQSDKYKTNCLVLWAPNADLGRDPRWGRNEEAFGEDPFFNGTLVVAEVQGMQGDDPKYWQTASLLKHFLANSNEDGRGGSSSDFDGRLMREYYSVPFRMGFLEGGARSFMASYNAWNHIPMTAHPILKSILNQEWGVDGLFSSDAGAIGHMVTQHKYAKDAAAALAASVKAGINQYLRGGEPEIFAEVMKQNLLTRAEIDWAARGKLRTILQLGLLDPPSRVPYSKIGVPGEPEPWTTEKHKAVARDMAHESVVLLKNANSFLPLDRKSLKSIAVIGPRAGEVLVDFYGGPLVYSVTPLQGIKDKAGAAITVNCAPDNTGNAAVNAAKSSDVAIVVVGNHPICGPQAGGMFNPDSTSKPCADLGEGREGRDRASIALSQEELIRQVYAANPKTVVVLVSNFPYAINWTQENVPAILKITHSAQEQGAAIADVLFGDYNPAGRLTQTWPKSLEQLPPMMDYDIRHGRTYMYMKETPLYPFGYGLSYTTFQYANLKVSPDRLPAKRSVTVSVDVKNTGKRDGSEVVQLYVQHPQSKVERPLKELRGFQRVSLKAGETKTVGIPLKAETLAWWNEKDHRWEVEKAPIRVSVGPSSADLKLQYTINVVDY